MPRPQTAAAADIPLAPPATYRNRMEAWMASAVPHYIPPSDEDILAMVRDTGVRAADLANGLEYYNRRQDEMLDIASGSLAMLGGAPVLAAPGVSVYAIPDAPFEIRLRPRDGKHDGLYCLEFFDAAAGKAADAPTGWEIYNLPQTIARTLQRPFVSWERVISDNEVYSKEACQTYSIRGGSRLKLARPDTKDFLFVVPHMPSEATKPVPCL